MKHLTTDSNSALAPEPVEAPFSAEFGRHIKFHTPEEFEAMRKAGRLAAEVLDFIAPKVVPGVTTGELDDLCHQYIIDHGALPAPLNYRGFPKSICTSVNHVICHGIPGPKVLKEGDILNIDITVDSRRMAWRHEPDVRGRRRLPQGGAPDRSDLRGHDARHRGGPARATRSATSAMRSSPMRRPNAARWCGISAATAWGACSTTPRTSSITAVPARA